MRKKGWVENDIQFCWLLAVGCPSVVCVRMSHKRERDDEWLDKRDEMRAGRGWGLAREKEFVAGVKGNECVGIIASHTLRIPANDETIKRHWLFF